MGIKLWVRDPQEELEPGTLVLRYQPFDDDGPAGPEQDLVIFGIGPDERDDDAADEACNWLEDNEPQARGYIFRVDSDDQGTTLYRIADCTWRRVGV